MNLSSRIKKCVNFRILLTFKLKLIQMHNLQLERNTQYMRETLILEYQ